MDAKGRVALPARLREALQSHGSPALVLTPWDGGIQMFTADRWRRMEHRFAGVSPFDRRSRHFLLAYVAGATELHPDTQGRFVVPPPLRRAAGLQRDCVLLSYLGTAELWDAQRWDERQGQALAGLEGEGGPDGFLAYDPDDDGEDL